MLIVSELTVQVNTSLIPDVNILWAGGTFIIIRPHHFMQHTGMLLNIELF